MTLQDHNAIIKVLDLGGSGPRVVVKDCIDIAGEVTACGSAALREADPAAAHADVVKNLLAADCHLVGKTNMHELAYGMTGVNGAFGTPINPKWPDRIPGGRPPARPSQWPRGYVTLPLARIPAGQSDNPPFAAAPSASNRPLAASAVRAATRRTLHWIASASLPAPHVV